MPVLIRNGEVYDLRGKESKERPAFRAARPDQPPGGELHLHLKKRRPFEVEQGEEK